MKGISITDPSADPLTFCVYILSFSLVLVAISDSNLGLKSSYRFNCVHRLSGFGFGSDSYRRVFCRFFTFVDLYTEEGNPSNCWIFLIRLGWWDTIVVKYGGKKKKISSIITKVPYHAKSNTEFIIILLSSWKCVKEIEKKFDQKDSRFVRIICFN